MALGRIGRNACQRKYFSFAVILTLAWRRRDCLSGPGFVASAQLLRPSARSTDLFSLARGIRRARERFCPLYGPVERTEGYRLPGVRSAPGAVTCHVFSVRSGFSRGRTGSVISLPQNGGAIGEVAVRGFIGIFGSIDGTCASACRSWRRLVADGPARPGRGRRGCRGLGPRPRGAAYRGRHPQFRYLAGAAGADRRRW